MTAIFFSAGFLILGGLVDGILEGYSFDGRKSFERKFGVGRYSYFGSLSWTRAYRDNNPSKGFKSWFSKWAGAFDFYHHADRFRKLSYIIGAFMAPSFLLLACFFVASSVAKAVGAWWVRE